MQAKVFRCNRVGFEQRVGSAGGSEVRVTFRADLPVDDYVRDMHAAWPELARHALRNSAQAELWRREIHKARAATQRCRGAREQIVPAPRSSIDRAAA